MKFSYDLVLFLVVASLIGYSTNWIAIRMLFRSLEEKSFWFRCPPSPRIDAERSEKKADKFVYS